jgi:alpha-tubulin suppressor-like RCC1 family protein
MPDSDKVQKSVVARASRVLVSSFGGLVAILLSHTANAQGQIVAWGDSSPSQLSTGTTSLIPFTHVDGGADFSLGLRADGSVAFWGWVGYGVPMPTGLGNIVQVAAGSGHRGVVRADGSVICWGSNFDNACVVPEDLGPVKQLSLGQAFSVALEQSGTVRCWGRNYSQQCNVPAGLEDVVSVSAGRSFVIAATSAGSVVGWGQ